MMLINWSDDDLVNFPILDEQHRGIISTINTLDYFIKQDWPITNLKPTVDTVIHNVKFHFKTEETILIKQNAPAISLAITRDYRMQFLNELNKHFEDAVNMSDPKGLTDYLVNWWSGHKLEYHDKLSNYLNPDVA